MWEPKIWPTNLRTSDHLRKTPAELTSPPLPSVPPLPSLEEEIPAVNSSRVGLWISKVVLDSHSVSQPVDEGVCLSQGESEAHEPVRIARCDATYPASPKLSVVPQPAIEARRVWIWLPLPLLVKLVPASRVLLLFDGV